MIFSILIDSASSLGSLESELLKFMTKALSFRYWKATNSPRSDQDKEKAVLAEGFQFIISKKLSNSDMGAYSEWDNLTPSIKTTAYVLKFLRVVKDYITIEDGHIFDTLNYLLSKQDRNGRFVDSGMSQEVSSQNTLEHVERTAYVVISILELTPQHAERYKTNTNKALKFIAENFDNVKDDNLVLASSFYALALGQHVDAENYSKELMAKADKDEKMISWSTRTTSKKDLVAISAYVILALGKMSKTLETPKILKWLIEQRNSDGQFDSTDDTVVGIQAIAAMAVHFYSEENFLDLFFYDDPKDYKQKLRLQHNVKSGKLSLPKKEGASVRKSSSFSSYKLFQFYYHPYRFKPTALGLHTCKSFKHI